MVSPGYYAIRLTRGQDPNIRAPDHDQRFPFRFLKSHATPPASPIPIQLGDTVLEMEWNFFQDPGRGSYGCYSIR
jgi:hypothetical protein